MIKEILILSGIMLLPFIEIRLAIPVGILAGSIGLPFGIHLSGMQINPIIVIFLAIFMGTLLGIILFNLLHFFDKSLKKSKFSKKYLRLLEKSQKKIHKKVEKYGKLGLAIWICLPIPGTGIYIGTLGGYALGFEKKIFIFHFF